MRGSCTLLVFAALLCPAAHAAKPARPPEPPPACEPAKVVLRAGTTEVRAPPQLPEPPAKTLFKDPVFGTCVTRVSDRRRDLWPIEDAPGLAVPSARVQAFNSNSSLALLRGLDAGWYVYNAKFWTVQRRLEEQGEIDPRWNPVNSDQLYYVVGTSLFRLKVESGQKNKVHDFAKETADWGSTLLSLPGNPSADGRYFAFTARRDSDLKIRGILVYDAVADRTALKLEVPDAATLGHVTFSTWGRFLVATFGNACAEGVKPTLEAPCGLVAIDRTTKALKSLAPEAFGTDTAVDAQQREVAVFREPSGALAMAELWTGARTELLDGLPSPRVQLSGGSVLKPGWIVASASASAPSGSWSDDLVFLVELKSAGRVVPLAHHRSRPADDDGGYFASPHATFDRSGTRVLFTSNWGGPDSPTLDTYEVTLAPDWPQRIARVAEARAR